jgi:hypothetical protein
MVKLIAIPMSLREANDFVENFHRHNGRTDSARMPGGGKFAVGVSAGDGLMGVAIVGRPIARNIDDGFTLEVRRTCVMDNSQKGANSFLYSRCWQAAKALGYRRLITYTLSSESGASLRGAGWKIIAESKPGKDGWNRPDIGRMRRWQPIYGQLKLRWEVSND